jgi:hypothetical protein
MQVVVESRLGRWSRVPTLLGTAFGVAARRLRAALLLQQHPSSSAICRAALHLGLDN